MGIRYDKFAYANLQIAILAKILPYVNTKIYVCFIINYDSKVS